MPGSKRSTVSVYLNPELLKQVDATAKQFKLSRSALIALAVARFLSP